MLSLAKIEQREAEILSARQQLAARLLQMDGALELIVLFKADLAAAEADAQAEADALLVEQEAERAALEAGASAEECDWANCRDARCGNGCVKLEAKHAE